MSLDDVEHDNNGGVKWRIIGSGDKIPCPTPWTHTGALADQPTEVLPNPMRLNMATATATRSDEKQGTKRWVWWFWDVRRNLQWFGSDGMTTASAVRVARQRPRQTISSMQRVSGDLASDLKLAVEAATHRPTVAPKQQRTNTAGKKATLIDRNTSHRNTRAPAGGLFTLPTWESRSALGVGCRWWISSHS
jgi:hypothetical protein